MQRLQLSKKIRRISILSLGEGEASTLYKAKKRKKKRSRALKPLEKAVRRLGKANSSTARLYLKRHKKSTRKKRDGWLRDFSYNIHRAARKHAKTMKVPRLLRI